MSGEEKEGGWGEMEEEREEFYIVATNCRRSDITMQGCKWKLLKLKQREVQ